MNRVMASSLPLMRKVASQHLCLCRVFLILKADFQPEVIQNKSCLPAVGQHPSLHNLAKTA